MHIFMAHLFDFVMATGSTMARWSDEAIGRAQTVIRRIDELNKLGDNKQSSRAQLMHVLIIWKIKKLQGFFEMKGYELENM